MGSWHARPVDALFEELEATPGGLTERQAAQRLSRYGPNELSPPKRPSLLRRIFEQMKDPMILVLLGAAGLSLAASGGHDWLDAVIILIIVVVNNIISITQEDHAQKALEELRKMASPMARCLRDGRQVRLEARTLVPGDIVYLEAGDQIPADCRILECAGLRCDESAMTGESVPVEKEVRSVLPEDAPLGDWHNMVISGTLVTAGRCTALVCATGMDTQMGHSAGLLLEGETQPTPLQRKMAEISKTLSFLCLCVCAVMFGIGLLDGKDMLEMFLTAVSLAVAAIPEGLPAIVTIVLALGVQRMAGRGAI
ncbi:MAG: HAD-IC family P-type ATPase, partial [Oscillibacter sp.]|nr:HAD-IC family P-type ATPase [Oscillibacter sp.]